jgi:hypothetical protein
MAFNLAWLNPLPSVPSIDTGSPGAFLASILIPGKKKRAAAMAAAAQVQAGIAGKKPGVAVVNTVGNLVNPLLLVKPGKLGGGKKPSGNNPAPGNKPGKPGKPGKPQRDLSALGKWASQNGGKLQNLSKGSGGAGKVDPRTGAPLFVAEPVASVPVVVDSMPWTWIAGGLALLVAVAGGAFYFGKRKRAA